LVPELQRAASHEDESMRIAAGSHPVRVRYVFRRRPRIEDLFRRFQRERVIPREADVVQLAAGLVAAVQGGYLLALTSRQVKPTAAAIDTAKAHLQLLARDQGEASSRVATGNASAPADTNNAITDL